MDYSDNQTVNDLVLTIINDGNGDQCGMTYDQRCAAAAYGLGDYRVACRTYGRYRHRVYDASIPTRAEVLAAATILQTYYRNHAQESAT